MAVRVFSGKVFSGIVWASIDKIGVMVFQFVVNIVLARLLVPEDFGYIGILTIFIAVSQTLIDGGFGSALIQKQNPTQTDYSTIFYWNLFIAVILYVILFFTAPFIAQYFKMNVLCDVLRAWGIVLIINSFVAIQNNRLRKHMAFRTIAIVDLSSYLLSAFVAIVLAVKNYSVWSLVSLYVFQSIFSSLLYYFISHWKPSITFSIQSLRELFSFGGFLLAANILQEIGKNVQGIIIGRNFSSTEMGLYSQAKKLDEVVSVALPNIIVQVMFPTFSQLQDDHQKLVQMLQLNVRIISFIIFPLMILLIIIAKPIIILLFGEKWVDCVPYFQILCIGGLFSCLQNTNYYTIAAIGKSKDLFIWSFFKWGLLIALLLVGMHWGMNGIMWGMVVSNLSIFMINAILVGKYLPYSFFKQCKEILPYFIISIIPAVLLFVVGKFLALHLAFQALSYVALYFLFVLILKLSVLKDFITMKNQLLRKNE